MVDLTVHASGRRLSAILILILLTPLTSFANTPASPHLSNAGNHSKVPLTVASIPKVFNTTNTTPLPNNEVNIFAAYTKEPAPMGIADYGVGPNGPYEYSTNSSQGIAEIVSLTTQNSTGSNTMTIQLNENLQFTLDGRVYVYWVQDVAFIDTSDDAIAFIDNIWNSSSHTAVISQSGLSGSGTVAQDGTSYFYYDIASASLPGNQVQLSLPAEVEFEIDSGMSASGQPVVSFSYNDGSGAQTYDSVTFLTSGRVTLAGFVVDGSAYNPKGLFYDSEFILGGPGGGLQTEDESSDVRLRLYYWNDHNFEMIPNAYNFGSDTAEGISNTLAQWYYVPATGANVAYVQAGAGSLGKLYDSSEIGEIVYNSTGGSGTLEVQNATDPSATPNPYPFVDGQATITIYPGTYQLTLSENDGNTNLGTYTVAAGQVVTINNESGAVQLTLSYVVQGGGSEYSAPILTYIHDGQQVTATLTTTPSVYEVDSGTTWSVSSSLPGSSTTERWTTDQSVNETALSPQTIQFTYQHQFLISAGYSVSGGGTPTAPQLAYVGFGLEEVVSLTKSVQSFWADAGSSYSVPSQLTGSTASIRWEVLNDSGVIQAPVSVTFQYFHQDFVTTLYVVSGGVTGYGAPSISCSQFGSTTESDEGSSLWVDADSSCTYPSTLSGSNQTVRWTTPSPDAVVDGPGALSITYYSQFSLDVAYTIVGGASPVTPTLRGTSFGTSSTTPLAAISSQEWLDAGSAYVLSNPLSSSTTNERWYTTASTAGVLNRPATISLVFYHQYSVSAEYSVLHGGSPPAPALLYTVFGSGASIQLTTGEQSFWADSGSHYSIPPTINGSLSTERWAASDSSGVIQDASALTFTYDHQYLLTIDGDGLPSSWYEAGAMASVAVDGIFGRASGSGGRVTSYSIDGGAATSITPTDGSFTIAISMNSPHTLSIGSVEQYQISISTALDGAIASITPPTIDGDDFWYDQGTPVSVTLDGVWNRTAGTGERLESYSLNGVSKDIFSSGTVEVLSISSLSSPQVISGTMVTQYQLTTNTGSISSVTPPSIVGDSGWYDTGTTVTINYAYSWRNASISSGQSRYNAIGYSIDGTARTSSLSRSGSGTFAVQLTMSSSHSVTVMSVVQYSLQLSGGNDVSLSLVSPTGDNFYDAGSTLTATTDYTWGLIDDNIRQSLTSFTLDSFTTNVTQDSQDRFTTPSITFDAPHILAFNSVTQYLVNLIFEDSTGARAIAPTSVEIQVGDPSIISVPSSGVWLDNGTRFQIYQVEWESSDVKPVNETTYAVSSPSNQTILDRVYDANLVATDYLGLPISGAKVAITLANGTTVQAVMANNGSVNIGEIPLGTYTARISYLGTVTSVDGDAAVAGTADAKVFASYPTFAIIAISAVIIVLALLLMLRRHSGVVISSPKVLSADQSAEGSSVLEMVCPNCGTVNSPSAGFCEECGASLPRLDHEDS